VSAALHHHPGERKRESTKHCTHNNNNYALGRNNMVKRGNS